jgi:hypothetical protein
MLLGGGNSWADAPDIRPRVYLCGKPARPIVALGGSMLDCEQGQWVLGRPHNQTGALRTMAYGLMSYDETAGTRQPVVAGLLLRWFRGSFWHFGSFMLCAG